MKRGFTLIELIFVLVVLGVIAAILFPVTARPRPGTASRSSCQSQLKNIGLGFQQYLQDSNEKFPIVASGGSVFGWADALNPYVKSRQIFDCPTDENPMGPSPRVTGYTDYWMNSRVSGRKQSDLAASPLTVLNGEGNDGMDVTDARYARSFIPAAWMSNTNSPIYRHLDGANFGFADGHVKWLSVNRLPGSGKSYTVNAGRVTFEID